MSPVSIDPLALRTLAAVVAEGSFERAAARLHVTPPAVSQRIRALEERCGAVLVVRGQPCTATALGARLVRHAERQFALDAELLADLPVLALASTADGPAGPKTYASLRIAVNADSLATWFLPVLAAVAARGDALLHLQVDDEQHTADALRRGEVVAAVTARATAVQGCRAAPLGQQRYLATASPAYVQRHLGRGVTARALQAAPCLRFNRKDDLQSRWVQREFGSGLVVPHHELPATASFVEATLLGVGWALNPQALVAEHLAAGRLVELKPGRPLDVPLFWQVSRLGTPTLAALSEAVFAAAQALHRQVGYRGERTRASAASRLRHAGRPGA